MRKLLILDDSEDLLFALQHVIPNYNFVVSTAPDIKTFVIELDIFKPDILLIDVVLKNRADGREVCKYLRELEDYKDLPIILFSSSAKQLEHFREYGADGIIEKPFTIKELVAKIDRTAESKTN